MSSNLNFDYGLMDEAATLLTKQTNNINEYFNTASKDFDTQYASQYGTEMGDAINAMAGSGIFDSPVSENALNRKRKALGEQYAVGKSALAGQKMTALGQVDQQRISYYTNLSNMRYQEQQAKVNYKQQNTAMMGSMAAALI